jgi:hypothetical protein
MTQLGEFANQKELRDYADAHGLEYLWEVAKRWRLAQLSPPGQYELVEVRTRRGMTKALLFSRQSCEPSSRLTLRFVRRSQSSGSGWQLRRAAKEK